MKYDLFIRIHQCQVSWPRLNWFKIYERRTVSGPPPPLPPAPPKKWCVMAFRKLHRRCTARSRIPRVPLLAVLRKGRNLKGLNVDLKASESPKGSFIVPC